MSENWIRAESADYVYDAFGRLLWRKGSDGTESRHYYDGINELLVREKPQAGSWRTRYVQALAQSDIGQVLARRTATGWSGGGVPSTWTDRYYHYDTLGNAVMESDHHGDIVAFVDMEAFGNVVAGGTGGPRLTTKWSDPDTGMYYFNERWYDCSNARFLQIAPLPVTLEHSYSYAEMNPVARVDPDGRVPLDIVSISKNARDDTPSRLPPPPTWDACMVNCMDYHTGGTGMPSKTIAISSSVPVLCSAYPKKGLRPYRYSGGSRLTTIPSAYGGKGFPRNVGRIFSPIATPILIVEGIYLNAIMATCAAACGYTPFAY